MYYNRDGEPIDLWAWSRLGMDPSYKRVAEDQVGPYYVSTIWLGLDHSFMRTPRPIIFETMVFATSAAAEGLGPDMDMQRYATEAEARQGHADMVTLIRATTVDVVEDETRENSE